MRRVEDPTDLMSKLESLQEAVAAFRQTFRVQFQMELELVGMPGTPNPDDRSQPPDMTRPDSY